MTRKSARTDHATLVVGIPTYKRPSDLKRLVETLPPAFGKVRDAFPHLILELLVVDNDPDGSAREIVSTSSGQVRYVQEVEPGVAAVRNRILAEAAHARFLVFIDDDEAPATEWWLHDLIATAERYDAQAVSGPVRTVVDGELDPWVAAGGFFDRAHRHALATGDHITRAATNNLLLDLDFVRAHGVRFNPRFGRSGGEDSLFTSELHRAGAMMVWCAEAVVLDHLPPSRRTRTHALDRSRGMAASGVRVSLALAKDSRRRRAVIRARAVAIGAARCASGALRAVFGRLTRSTRLDALGRKDLARGAGAIEGAFDRVHAQYGGG